MMNRDAWAFQCRYCGNAIYRKLMRWAHYARPKSPHLARPVIGGNDD